MIDSVNTKEKKIYDDFVNLMNIRLEPKVGKIDYIYHYTSIPSFINIIKTNELWFSHASFLNDPLEIAFGLDVITNILKTGGSDYTNILDIIEKQRSINKKRESDLTNDLVFLFSFSELSDKLSSWIQYGDSGYGVCLEFIRPKIMETFGLHTSQFSNDIFFPIQYFSSKCLPHSNNIKGFNEELLNYYKEMEEIIKTEGIEKEQNIQRKLYEVTKSIACFIKNDFHADEEEWRYVTFPVHNDENILIHPANHGVRMSYKITLDRFIDFINHIIVGPCHNKDPKISASLKILVYQEQGAMYNIEFSKGILRSR